MGMFDYLICEHPLPDGDMQKAVFQTKSLDSDLEYYRISGDGRLYRALGVIGELDPHEEEYDHLAGLPEWEGPLPFHGEVTFYDMDKQRQWFEYIARFSEGHLLQLGRKGEATEP